MGFSLKNIFKDDDDIDNLNGTEDTTTFLRKMLLKKLIKQVIK